LRCTSANLAENEAALATLYSSLAFAVFLGGWITSLLSVSVSSPLIAQEFERQTWDVLATTPISTSKIVFSRFGAGMWQLRYWFLAQILLRGVFLTVSLGLLLSQAEPFNPVNLAWIQERFAQAPAGAVIFCAALVLFVLVQPILTAAVNVALGLCCSTLGRSAHRARQAALVARVILWVVVWTVAIGVFFMAYQSQSYEASFIDSPWQISSHFFSTILHLNEFSSLLNALQLTGAGGVLLAGLAGLTALTLISTWGFLQLATASLGRHRL
jgi:ABC-type transport system involved in multi-copper enzyme maturation permease subunit